MAKTNILRFSLIILLSCTSTPEKHKIDDPNNITNQSIKDFENILNEQEENELKKIIIANNDIFKVVIVTTSTYDVDFNIEDFSIRTFENWGIGSKDKNDGLLIVLSEANKETRITPGAGFDNILTKEKTQKIINEMMPYFQNKEYGNGLKIGISQLKKIITSNS